jgi:hypothetical protein
MQSIVRPIAGAIKRETGAAVSKTLSRGPSSLSSGAPSSELIITTMSTVPTGVSQPASTDKLDPPLSPTDTQLLTNLFESNLSSKDIIASSTVLRQTFKPNGTASESSMESAPTPKGESDVVRLARSGLGETRMGRGVHQALTQPLPKTETYDQTTNSPSKTGVAQKKIWEEPSSKYYEILQSRSHDSYVCQKVQPTGSDSALADHTVTAKECRVPINEVVSTETIDDHMAEILRDGVVSLIPAAKHALYCKTAFGHPADGRQFAVNKAQFHAVCREFHRKGYANEQIEAQLEIYFGIPHGEWKNLLVAEFLDPVRQLDPRFVTGKEESAGTLYFAGGSTKGGMQEVTVKLTPVTRIVFHKIENYIPRTVKEESAAE